MIPLNSNLNEIIKEYLDKVHEKLFEKALKIREQKTYVAKTIEDLKTFINLNLDLLKLCYVTMRNVKQK